MKRAALVVLVLLVVLGALAAPAGAYTIAGAPWPNGKVLYHVDAPALRSAVEQAAARWNQSGARIHFTEVAAARAAIRVRRLPAGPCSDVVGRAPVGRGPGGVGIVFLRASCGPLGLIPIAAHELGHVLGFGHEAHLCSIMSPEEGDRPRACGGPGALPWEYDCRVLEPNDIAGAVKLYGGRARPPRAGFPFCPTLPTPPPATDAHALAFPASSLATTSVRWNVKPAASLRHVLVNRGAGTCPSYPSVPGVSPIEVRPAVKVRRGNTVAYLPPRTGAQSLLDVARLDPGRWCYSVWTIGPGHRYTRAANAFVRVGPRPTLATQLGLTATALPATVPEVAVSFRIPSAVDAVRVERISGACPPPGIAIPGEVVGQPAPTPGAISVTDSTGLTPGAWCYAVHLQVDDQDLDPALVQVVVPPPTP
jgi:Astacin (Peptidase family M12A)